MRNLERANRRKSYYDTLLIIENEIDKGKSIRSSVEDIISKVEKIIKDNYIFTDKDYTSHIYRPVINMVQTKNYTKNDPSKLDLVLKFTEYTTALTDKQQVSAIFSVIQYWKNPHKMEIANTNWKEIMGRKN